MTTDGQQMDLRSDVNKDLGPKAKDTGHKAKAKALGYQGQGQGQGLGSQGQGQGLEMSRPITTRSPASAGIANRAAIT